MIGECTLGYLTHKVFPCVTYTTGLSGNAVQVAVTGYGAWSSPGTSTETPVPGHIWIGTDDGAGNVKTEGHAFASRPKRLSYWKKNTPLNGEASRIQLEILAADGTVIAKAISEDVTIDTAGTEVTLDLQYTDLTKKAASIKMSILASTVTGKPKYKKSTITMAGKTYDVNLGSSLIVDHIRLHY